MAGIGLDEEVLAMRLGPKWATFQVLLPPPSASNTGKVMDGSSEAWTSIKKFLRSEAASMAMTPRLQESGCSALAKPKVPPESLFPTPKMRGAKAARDEAKLEELRWQKHRMELSRRSNKEEDTSALLATFDPKMGPPKVEDAFSREEEGVEEEGGDEDSGGRALCKPRVQSWLMPKEDKSMWSSVDEWRAGERGAATGYKVESFRELRSRRKVFVGIDELMSLEKSQKTSKPFTWGGRLKTTKAPFNPERNRLIHRGFYVT